MQEFAGNEKLEGHPKKSCFSHIQAAAAALLLLTAHWAQGPATLGHSALILSAVGGQTEGLRLGILFFFLPVFAQDSLRRNRLTLQQEESAS